MTDSKYNANAAAPRLLRKWVDRVSPAGDKARLLIVKYHRVESQTKLNRNGNPVQDFEDQIQLLKTVFNILTVGEAAVRLEERTLPARALCITFDDGYADNYNVALPILERHNLQATFFVTSGLLDRPGMWGDRIASIFATAGDRAPEMRNYLVDAGMPVRYPDLMNKLKYMSVDAQETIMRGIAGFGEFSDESSRLMNADELRSLVQRGMEVGGHTVSHTILTNLDSNQARDEIGDCKSRLESIVGSPVVSFAFPNGRRNRDYSERDVEIVRESGFRSAVNTEFGLARFGDELLELPRIPEYYLTPQRLFRIYL